MEETTGENLDDPGFGDGFVDTIPEARSTKGIIDKVDLIK